MASKGISIFKQGWHQIPEVMGSLIYCGVGFVFAGLGLYRITKNYDDFHKYRYEYTVIRPDSMKKDKPDLYN